MRRTSTNTNQPKDLLATRTCERERSRRASKLQKTPSVRSQKRGKAAKRTVEFEARQQSACRAHQRSNARAAPARAVEIRVADASQLRNARTEQRVGGERVGFVEDQHSGLERLVIEQARWRAHNKTSASEKQIAI